MLLSSVLISVSFTYFNGETRRKLHVDEVLQLLEVSVGDGEEVHDGHHLLLQGQGVILAQPQLGPELLTLLTFLPGAEAGFPGLEIRGECLLGDNGTGGGGSGDTG